MLQPLVIIKTDSRLLGYQICNKFAYQDIFSKTSISRTLMQNYFNIIMKMWYFRSIFFTNLCGNGGWGLGMEQLFGSPPLPSLSHFKSLHKYLFHPHLFLPQFKPQMVTGDKWYFYSSNSYYHTIPIIRRFVDDIFRNWVRLMWFHNSGPHTKLLVKLLDLHCMGINFLSNSKQVIFYISFTFSQTSSSYFASCPQCATYFP